MELTKDIFYNIATQDITNGLKDFEISSAQDYFILLSAPSNANVKIKLNSVTAHEIPIKENWQFSSEFVGKMYISCDAVVGEKITYGQADGNLKIVTNPTINRIDTIGGFEQSLLTNLDKIINPFKLVGIDSFSTTGTGSTAVTVADFLLDCDKIQINSIFPNAGTTGYNSIEIFLDNVLIKSSNFYYRDGSSVSSDGFTLDIQGVLGKRFLVKIMNAGLGYCGASILKYNKKV